MKQLLVIMLVGLASASPLAFAQEQDAEPYIGGGFGLEFIGGGSAVALTFQGGADNLLGPLGLRGNFDAGISGSYFELAVDLLTDFPSDDLDIYAGGGFGIVPGDEIDFNIHGTGGLEFFATDTLGLFSELQPRLYVTGGTRFSIGLRFGANYHFN